MPGTDPIQALCELVKGLRVTFDPERSIAKPCIGCGTLDDRRDLIHVGTFIAHDVGFFVPGDKLRRPMCEGCRISGGLDVEQY